MPGKRPRSEPERRFYANWQVCAKRSQCDASDGAEYRRVYREWMNAGRPARVQAFIRARANIGPGGAP